MAWESLPTDGCITRMTGTVSSMAPKSNFLYYPFVSHLLSDFFFSSSSPHHTSNIPFCSFDFHFKKYLGLVFQSKKKKKLHVSTETMATKADSAVLPSAPAVDVDASKAKGHRRGSSSVTDVYKPAELSMSSLSLSLFSVLDKICPSGCC